ncbi:MAG: subclass B1 metallo-beta-lactamase [Bacteroidota bacterium]
MVGFFFKKIFPASVIVLLILLNGCKTYDFKTRFESDHLQILHVPNRVTVHVSYLHAMGYGKVKCNGVIFIDGDEALVVDAPTNDIASAQLIEWIENEQKCKIVAEIPTHFHRDCIGGIAAFERNLKTKVGNETILLSFHGSGHTLDNIISYFPSEKVLFGGCLVKSIGAKKGYLGDADTTEWTNATNNIRCEFKNFKVVIPGHGKPGGPELLDYIAILFDE